ncbi:hypothetical protein, partial [Frankia nepalensis]|uniref:hypothetical protein n=1 Tax=Frankia nepalensis TaxID=1836974 RepID=UPI001EE407C6
ATATRLAGAPGPRPPAAGATTAAPAAAAGGVEPKPAEEAVPTSGARLANGATTNCPGNPYAGVWVADDPNGFIASVTIAFTDCNKYNTSRIRVVSHSWMGLSGGYWDWGTANNVSWGYVGTSVTVTYYFNSGFTEKLRILPSVNGSGISTDGHESWPDGDGRNLPTQRYHRY